MPQEPQELAANEWGAISYYPQWNTLELKWGQQTMSMSDHGFRKTLQIMAEQGLKVRPKYMIVDSTEFFHELGEGTLAWRNEHIVPLYNDAGVRSSPSSSPAPCLGRSKRALSPPPWARRLPDRLVRDQGADA
jgi:hypothetical protein